MNMGQFVRSLVMCQCFGLGLGAVNLPNDVWAGSCISKHISELKEIRNVQEEIEVLLQNPPEETKREIHAYLGWMYPFEWMYVLTNPTEVIIRLSRINSRLRDIAKTIASSDNFRIELSKKHLTEKAFRKFFGSGGLFENAKSLSIDSASPEML